MKCQRCGSERILSAGCKCSDMFTASVGDLEIDGYVPDDLGIGGGDYVELDLCLDCGQLQGKFPLPLSKMEQDASDKDLEEFFEESFNEGELFVDIFASRRARIKKSSEDLSLRLRKYISNMFDYHCDIGSKSRVPSVTRFMEMYKKGSFDI